MKIDYLQIAFISILIFAVKISNAQTYNPDLIFGVPGTNGDIYCSTASGNDIYIGGSFSQAGSIKANNIVKWNGLNWDSLGAGVVGTVKALLVKGDYLYVGGQFSITGLSDVAHLARWNLITKQWSAVGSQSIISGNYEAEVHTFAEDGDFIYVGGRFSWINSINNLGSIIKYNTITDTWIPIGSFSDVTAPLGWEANVNQIIVNGGLVYIAGDFTNIGYVGGGGANCNTVVAYNGSTFTNVGSNNLLERVNSICFDGSQLYAAGELSYNGLKPVAMLSGGTWVSLANQLPASISEVKSLAVYNNEIYAGAIGSTTQNIAIKWDGAKWQSVSNGVNTNTVSNNSATSINSLLVTASGVYAFGSFKICDGYICNNAAFFNGSKWRVLGSTIWGIVRVIKQKGNDMYVGGSFTIAGSDTVNNIARWDGLKWNTLGKGITGAGVPTINAIAFKGDTIFAGGSFAKAGDVTTSGISYFINNIWYDMDGGVAGEVNDIEVVGENVYVAGGISKSIQNYDIGQGILLWNAGAWKSMGKLNGSAARGVAGTATDLETGPDGSLYIAGDFITANGVTVNGITRWDGRDFYPVGGGFPVSSGYHVYSLKVYKKNIYVAGSFSDAAGVANTQNIAYWDGANWNSVGNADGRILGLETDGVSLYASGAFNAINNIAAARLAVWDGLTWSPTLPASTANVYFSDYNGNYQHKFAVTCNSIWVPGVFNSYSIVKIDKAVCSQSLSLVSPTGNESWTKNSQKIISWNFTDVNTLQIEYSTDGGSNWLLIAAAVPAISKNYLWTIPAVNSSAMLVKITSEQNNTIYDLSTPFSTNSNASISFLGPDANETFYSSCSIPLYWKSNNLSDVKIEYSEFSGYGNSDPWIEITTVPASTGMYDWKIPAKNAQFCRIRISNAADAEVADSSGLSFGRYYSTSCPVLTLNTPSFSNLSYSVGAVVSLNWSTQNLNVSNAKLELSTDNGASWSVINADVAMAYPSFGSFDWTVPNTPSSQCFIRVTDLADPSYSDISDNCFSINAPNALTILSPNGGENYVAGDAQTVTWNFQGTDGAIYVALKYGSTLTMIGSANASDGSFAYLVPNKISDQCRIWIYYSDFSLADSSNADFSIAAGAAAAATISSPASNSSITANSNVIIEWVVSNATNITLEYSTNYGSSWINIVSSLPPDNVRLTAYQNGQYQWLVPNNPNQTILLRIKDGATNTVYDQITLSVTVATGLQSLASIVEELNLYPMPVMDFVNLSYSKGILKTEVYSFAGIKIEEFEKDLSQISLGHLKQGMYIIKIFTQDQKVFTKSFVKE